MDKLYAIISINRSERQLPRVTLEDLEVNDVIQTLRGVSAGTDINAMYNPQDSNENNIIKGTGYYVPDDAVPGERISMSHEGRPISYSRY